MTITAYEEVEYEVEVEVDHVVEFIADANGSDLEEIAEALIESMGAEEVAALLPDHLGATMDTFQRMIPDNVFQQMLLEEIAEVFHDMTLEDLDPIRKRIQEKRLGRV